MVPEVGDGSVRELSLYAYRILYEISMPDIYILAVAHERQKLELEEIPHQPGQQWTD